MRRITSSIGILMALAAVAASPARGAGEASPPVQAHAALACNGCHLRGAGERTLATAQRRCAGCHDAAPSPRGAFHSRADHRCLDCHGFHRADRVRTGRGTLALPEIRAAAPAHCLSCHGEGGLDALSAAHAEAGRLYHGDAGVLAGTGPSAGCIACHDRQSRSPWRRAVGQRELTFFMHASHPQGVRVVPGSGRGASRIHAELDPRIPLFDGRIECQTCHALTAGTRFLLRPFPERDGLCLGCHRVGPEPAAGGADVAVLGRAR